MRRLLDWWRGYTVEQWVKDLRVDGSALYAGLPSAERMARHLQEVAENDTGWHLLLMTFRRGQRRFYFDGRPWPQWVRTPS